MNEERIKQAENIEDSIHIRAVRFGAAYPKGFTHKDIKELYEPHRKKEWEIVEEFLAEATNNKAPNAIVQRVTPFIVLNMGTNVDDRIYTLSYEAAFHYLGYIELKQSRIIATEAQQMASEAQRTATRAIVISIVSLFITALLTVWQIYSPVTLDRDQFHYLIKTIHRN